MDRKAEKAQQHRLFSHLCLMMMIMMKYNYTDNDSQQNENVLVRSCAEVGRMPCEESRDTIGTLTTAQLRCVSCFVLFPFVQNFLFIQAFLLIL